MLLLLVVLALALLTTRGCAGDGPVTKDEAIAKARSVQAFEPEAVQVRFLRRGLPPRPTWVVSLYRGSPTRPTRTQLVLVDSETGEIVDDGR